MEGRYKKMYKFSISEEMRLAFPISDKDTILESIRDLFAVTLDVFIRKIRYNNNNIYINLSLCRF